MKKVFFFGTGYCARLFASKVKIALNVLGDFQVIGYLDNDKSKTKTLFEGSKVYSPDILKNSPCDMVLIFLLDSVVYEEVFKQITNYVPTEKIHRYDFPLEILIQNRYKDSSDVEIKETLKYISCHGTSIFNQFINGEYTYDEVHWDSYVDLPYIDFTTVEGKKVPMYYPKDYKFFERNGRLYVVNLLREQLDGSPHLYVKENHNINDGDCIIDAGVCEGNFALKYVDVASHIYLFEMAPVWQKPLRCTFKNYESKITIIDKAVLDITSEKACRIDDVVKNEKVDFIKMDIEGAEVAAIRGAEQTFSQNDIKSSICCYHRNGDEREIRLQLEKHGYRTSVSDGYMLFLHSDDTWELGDFRRGIVYGYR